LKPEHYSQCYRDQFLALINRFDEVTHVTGDFDFDEDTDADVIIIYDVHSSFHVELKNIQKHKAVKYTYFNDPYQDEFKGKYQNGPEVHKLGPRQRSERALVRGVDYIICPYENLYYKYIAPYAGDKLLWFPVSPDHNRFTVRTPLKDRRPEVLLNGHIWPGTTGFRPYAMRIWAYKQNSSIYALNTDKIFHKVLNKDAPSGIEYPNFLGQYAGALALCDTHTVPKYLEIPMAGCVCLAQYLYDYQKMGFEDGESCLYVNKGNYNRVIADFKKDPAAYQGIANEGRKVALNWTADKFADYIYKHAEKHHGKK
jgi:hypothetical protein